MLSVSVMRLGQVREGVLSLHLQHPEQYMVVLNIHSLNKYLLNGLSHIIE